MSLYDGLDIGNKDTKNGPPAADVAGWSSSYKLLQSQLQAKRASGGQVGKPRPRQIGRLPPVVDLKKNIEGDFGLQFDHVTGKVRVLFYEAIDEYDPLHPNEYDEIMKLKRVEKERMIEEDRKIQADEDRKKRFDRSRDDDDRNGSIRDRSEDRSDMDTARRRREEAEEEEFSSTPRRASGAGGAAIAPPQALVDTDIMNNSQGKDTPPPASGSVASKIMAKYGYRQGQGLGKSEQGMSIALQIEKTSKRGGKIIHERDIMKANAEAQAQSNTNLLKNPSKVILLQNMVGPGEVDEELEPETAEECSKYGKVIKCVCFEIPVYLMTTLFDMFRKFERMDSAIKDSIPDVPDDCAVRLFVEFERMESAIKALVDLNGRFFGGRTVRGCFYNLDKFRRMDYSDNVE